MNEYNTTYTNTTMNFRTYLEKVFSTMAVGLGISAIVAVLVDVFMYEIYAVLGNAFSIMILVSCFVELGVAVYLSARLRSMSKTTAWTLYIFYSVLTGLSLGVIIQQYTYGSVAFAFVSATILFVCMSIIGHTTHLDLSRFSSLMMAGLFAIIISSVLNALIFRSVMANYLINVVSIIIFLGLVAYDIQKLRYFYESGSIDDEMNEKMIIMGAFGLYLDFINIFIRLLQIFGNRRRNN